MPASTTTSSLAIHADNVSKIYRRFAHKRQFATLKSAILSGSLVRDLKPDETFRALDGVSFDVQAGRIRIQAPTVEIGTAATLHSSATGDAITVTGRSASSEFSD